VLVKNLLKQVRTVSNILLHDGNHLNDQADRRVVIKALPG